MWISPCLFVCLFVPKGILTACLVCPKSMLLKKKSGRESVASAGSIGDASSTNTAAAAPPPQHDLLSCDLPTLRSCSCLTGSDSSREARMKQRS